MPCRQAACPAGSLPGKQPVVTSMAAWLDLQTLVHGSQVLLSQHIHSTHQALAAKHADFSWARAHDKKLLGPQCFTETGVGPAILDGFTTRIWMQLRPDLDRQ
jgi:hypothetical protein